VVPWLRQRLASFEDASLQGMAGKKSALQRIVYYIKNI
jgi:hypothetical protein